MNIKFARLLALSGLLVTGSAAADGFALGVKAGTLGAGVEGTFGISPRVNLRLGANSYTYSYEETASGIEYDADLDLKSGALLLDWHPFKGVFRLSAGYMYNKNALQLRATPTEDQEIGGTTFTPQQIGTLTGDMTFKKGAPYVGFGWGNAARGWGLGFSLEIGAMFQGSPEVALASEGGTESNNAAFQQRLREEEQEIEDDLEEFKVYPVISLGLSFRF